MSDEERDNRDEHDLPRKGELLRWSEETQRKVEFIISQQAQFTVDMQSLREAQARSEQKWERTAEGITALLAIAEIHEREIAELREAQARTDAQMAETDERLNALIDTAEKMISERRNGGGAGKRRRNEQ
jgi:hypothetical protein